MAADLARLAEALGHSFTKPDLLTEALTHPSIAGRGTGARQCYERLEFLGDRVLGLVIAELLVRRFPREAEGALARRLAGLVRREACARVAEAIGLAPHLSMSRGEEEAGGRANVTTLADACEAVIGALYSDGGLEAAAAFIHRHWEPLVAEALTPPKDAKTALQEWAQGLGKPLPIYHTVAMKGPPHDPIFEVSVAVAGIEPVTAEGASKRTAEQAAAAAMLSKVRT
jgi:ribonuclease-3